MFEEFEDQDVELLPARTVMSVVTLRPKKNRKNGGDGGNANANGPGNDTAKGGDGGNGGDGGMGGDGGKGGGSSSSSSSGGGPTPLPTCGNGVIDPGEQCDTADFGGKTCMSFGLGSGDLICNPFCGIVVSSCVPKENCVDYKDNDQDGLTDCADDTCFMETACLDSCYQPKSLNVPGWFSGDSSGRPNLQSASCSPTSGNEAIFEVLIPQTGTFTATVSSWASIDFTVSVRTTCADPTSELACSNNGNPSNGKGDSVSVDVVQGQKIYVVVDGAEGGSGPFDINLNMPEPEYFCTDFYDDDQDGYYDCDDATNCKLSSDCQPGMKSVGEPCYKPSDCAANAQDPACLESWLGFPGGYCSEWCDLAAQDCSGDAWCADIGLGSVSGVCLDGCTTDTDCRLGYACVDEGYPTKVCRLGPEADCSNFADDDEDDLIDCEDPSCQGTAACQPGSKIPGQPCTASNECYAVNGDPHCMTEDWYGWAGGYCSEFCTFQDDCAPGSVCVSWHYFPSGAGTCLKTCLQDAHCRPGYTCFNDGFNPMYCVP